MMTWSAEGRPSQQPQPLSSSLLNMQEDQSELELHRMLHAPFRSLNNDDMSKVVKLGPWGGDGGVAHDITVAPQRLESITIRSGYVVDSLAFSYRDREKQLHTAGPWGGTGGLHETTITLEASDEYVTEVAGAVGPFGDVPRVIAWLKIVTNRATYGPFGHGEGTPFNIPVLNNGSIVGMFARAGNFLDAVGFYILSF